MFLNELWVLDIQKVGCMIKNQTHLAKIVSQLDPILQATKSRSQF